METVKMKKKSDNKNFFWTAVIIFGAVCYAIIYSMIIIDF